MYRRGDVLNAFSDASGVWERDRYARGLTVDGKLEGMNTTGLKRLAKDRIGISWQHPLVAAGLPVIDGADWAVRRFNGLAYLPPYSVRIRSRGVNDMFGGRMTVASSSYFRNLLMTQGGLGPDSDVLDIGCGCGLTALSLVDDVEPGHFTGVDVDRVSVASALRNQRLAEARFAFQHIDVASDVYSGGDASASTYRFPFSSNTFSHVIMTSVVTHLQPAELRNYLREIDRMLRPDGRLIFSTFIEGLAQARWIYSFPHQVGEAFLADLDHPSKGVAYSEAMLKEFLAAAGLGLETIIRGTWRHGPARPGAESAQDIVLARGS